jgi:hypothetical protein
MRPQLHVSSSGSLAMLAAIRRASYLLINLAADRRPGSFKGKEASYSITSSARASSVDGNLRSSCFAVLRLITS